MSGMTIAEVRRRFPQYGDLSDQELADALHQRFYSDMPRSDFLRDIGMPDSSRSPVPRLRPDPDAPRTRVRADGLPELPRLDAPPIPADTLPQIGLPPDPMLQALGPQADAILRGSEMTGIAPFIPGQPRPAPQPDPQPSAMMDDYRPDMPFDPRAMPGVVPQSPYGQTTGDPLAALMMPPGPVAQEPGAFARMDRALGRGLASFQAEAARGAATYDSRMMDLARASLAALEQQMAGAMGRERDEIAHDIARLRDEIAALEARTAAPEYQAGIGRALDRAESMDAAAENSRRLIGDPTQFPRAFASGVTGATGAAIEGMGLIGRRVSGGRVGEGLQAAGRRVLDYSQEIAPDPETSGFGTDVVSGTGSMGLYLVPGAAATWLTRGASAGVRAGAGIGAAATLAGPGGASEQYGRALAAGLREDEALRISMYGIPAGVVQVAPVGVILRRLPPDVQGRAAGQIRHVAEAFLAEFTAETAGALMQNFIEQSYNPERGVWDDSLYQGLVGGTSAAVIQALIQAATRGRGAFPVERREMPQAEARAVAESVQSPPVEAQQALPSVAERGEAPPQEPPAQEPETPTPGEAVTVQIGGQAAFDAEIVRQTIAGTVIREPDGTETLLPVEDIEDGEIVIAPRQEQAPAGADEAAGQAGGTGDGTAPGQSRALDEPAVGVGDPPAAGEPAPVVVSEPPVRERQADLSLTGERQADPLVAAMVPPAQQETPAALQTDPILGAMAPQERSPAREAMQRDPASWVIRDRETGAVVMETFDRRVIEALNTARYEAVPIAEHLEGLNARPEAAPAAPTAPQAQTQERSDGDLQQQAGRDREGLRGRAEAVAPGAIPSRPIREDTAVTARGREVPVTYAVVEADSLIPSHLSDGRENPAYPHDQGLQPRDRTRAASQTQIDSIASRIRPRELGETPKASDGAPIIAPNGVVESGNGRTIGIQRAYAEDGDSASRYRAWLEEQGYPTQALRKPVLVRIRQGEMSLRDRQAFVREANERDTQAMSVSEQAMADARAMSPGTLARYRGGDIDAAANRDFVRDFLREAVGEADRAAMIARDGSMSQDAVRRVQAALLARAYGDAGLIANLMEGTDTSIKAIGGALTDVAAQWAQMRELAASGTIDPSVDQTAALIEAVKLVDRARRDGRRVAEFVGQTDMFSGDSISGPARAFLNLFFRNIESYTQPVARDKLADALRFYVGEAEKTAPGADLLGQSADPQAITAAARRYLERQYGDGQGTAPDLFAQPARNPGYGARETGAGRERPDPAAAETGRSAADQGRSGEASGAEGVAEGPTTLEAITAGVRRQRAGERLSHIYAEHQGRRYYLASVSGNPDSAAAEWRKTYPGVSIYTTDRADGTSINGDSAALEAAMEPAAEASPFAADDKTRTATFRGVEATAEQLERFVSGRQEMIRDWKKSQRQASAQGKADLQTKIDSAEAGIAEAEALIPELRGETAQSDTTPKAKIEDFGEKIGGARKDTWAGFSERMAEAENFDLAAEPLSKTWPEPDYQKMIDGGADPWSVAFIRAARDTIPRKPSQSWKKARWAEQVRIMRDFAKGVLEGRYSRKDIESRIEDNKGLDAVAGAVSLYETFGHDKSFRDLTFKRSTYSTLNGKYYPNGKTFWEVTQQQKATAFSNMPRVLARGDTRAEALEAFRRVYAGMTKDGETKDQSKADRRAKFIIWSKRGDAGAGYFVGVKIGSNYITLREGIKEAKEARRIVAEEADQLQAQLDRMRDVPRERRDENSPRVGADHRGGVDVTPEMFQDAFRFRGVEFGNYVEGERRQRDLNEAYDALMDLAGILGVPSQALSLNGTLGLAFGARGTGGKNAAAAHYEPGKIVINLTKAQGRGSLAHEWFHALDNYFARARVPMRGTYITDNTAPADVNIVGIRPEVVNAFLEVKKAIARTELKKRSSNIDRLRTKDYWGTGIEMHARAFESYVIAKLQDQGASNDYLANVVNGMVWGMQAELSGLGDSYPYLKPDEIEVVRPAFDALFDTIETRQTERGVEMYSRRTPLYSATLRTAEALPMARGSGAQFMAMLQKQPGVKREELEWLGIPDFLRGRDRVTRDELVEHIRANQVQVVEHRKGGETDADDVKPSEAVQARYQAEWDKANASVREAEAAFDDAGADLRRTGFTGEAERAALRAANDALIAAQDARERLHGRMVDETIGEMGGLDGGPTKFDDWRTRGGRGYRELLLAMQDRPDAQPQYQVVEMASAPGTWAARNAEGSAYGGLHRTREAAQAKADEINARAPSRDAFKSSHWSEPNVLAHIRFDERDVQVPLTEAQRRQNERRAQAQERIGQLDRELQQVIGGIGRASDAYRSERMAEVSARVQSGEITRQEAMRLFREIDAESARPSDLTAKRDRLLAQRDELRRSVGDHVPNPVERTLFIQEIQSDWHQVGRKRGYRTGAPDEGTAPYGWGDTGQASQPGRVPDAPLKKTWHETAFRRAVAWAVEHGYDSVTWATGDMNAELFDLSQRVSEIAYWRDGNDWGLSASGLDGNNVLDQQFVSDADLEGMVGKDVAEAMRSGVGETESAIYGSSDGVKFLSGENLKVGGEGMRGFYDRIIPAYAAKWGKRFGASVGKVRIPVDGGDGRHGWRILAPWESTSGRWAVGRSPDGPNQYFSSEAEARAAYEAGRETAQVWHMPITDAMRETVQMEGVALFRRTEDPRPALDAKRAAIKRDLAEAWGRLNVPDDVRLRVVDRLFGMDAEGNTVPVDGSYVRALVQVALDSTEGALNTLHHEAIHMLRDPHLWGRPFGLFTEAEWRALETAAAREWMDKHRIGEDYYDLPLHNQIEEAIAAEFSEAWAAKRAPKGGLLVEAFNKIARFIKALGRALRGAGFRDPQAVWDAILSGKVGARGRVEAEATGEAAEQFSRGGLLSSASREALEADLARAGRADPAYPLAQIPPALSALGIQNNPLVVRKSVIEKAMGKHGLSLAEALQAVEGLSDPVMVFDSASVKDGLVALVDAGAGRNLVVAVHPEGEVGRMAVSIIASVHAKDKAASVLGWVESGLTRYVNKAKADAWFQSRGLYLPREGITHRRGQRIIQHRDVFKGERFSRQGRPPQVPEAKPLADTSFTAEAIRRIQEANAVYGPPAGLQQLPMPATFVLPQRTGLMALREGQQDRFIMLRAVQDAIKAATGEALPESHDAYLKQTLFTARTADRMDRMRKTEVKALTDQMRADGVSLDDLGVYMLAKHAPERNAEMARRDPERFKDGNGSGVYDEAAQALLDDLREQGKLPALERSARLVRQMIDADLQLRRTAGLISDEQYQSYRKMYRNYVPLRGFAERDDGGQLGRMGSGFDMRGKEIKEALGRMSIAENPVVQAISMRQEGIVRAEKNRVVRSLLRLVQANPHPELWEVVGKLPTRNVLDPETGMVKAVVDFGHIDPDHALGVKVGGQTIYMRINDHALLSALNNMQGDWSKVERIMKGAVAFMRGLQRTTTLFSRVNTALNLNFTIPNAQSDIMEGAWTAYNADHAGMTVSYLKAYPLSLVETCRAELGDSAMGRMLDRMRGKAGVTKAEMGRYQRYREEWEQSGGRINFMGFRDMDEITRDISREIGRLGQRKAAEVVWGAIEEAGAVLEKFNQPVEGAGRLAMYIAARENGFSREKAAALALDATANYYRQGNYTKFWRAAYAFWNPAVQGIEKAARFFRRPKNWLIMGGIMATGYAMGKIAIMAHGDDDDPEGRSLFERIPQFDRHRSIIIPTGIHWDEVTEMDENGVETTRRVPRLEYTAWRVMYQLRPVLALGQEIALAEERVRRGTHSPGQAAAEALGAFWQAAMMSWNPFGDSNYANMAAPTILDPVIDVGLNRKWTGLPVYPDDRFGSNSGIPRSSQFFERSNSRLAVETAQILNRVTGGTEYEPGMVDIYPGVIDHFFDHITGGLGRLAKQVGGMAADLATGTPTEPHNVPVVRSFVGRTGGWPEQRFYYDTRSEMREAESRARQAWRDFMADPDNESARRTWESYAVALNVGVRRNGQLNWTQSLTRVFLEADGELRDLRDQLTGIMNDRDLGRRERTERGREIRLQMEAIQRRARERYHREQARNLSGWVDPDLWRPTDPGEVRRAFP